MIREEAIAHMLGCNEYMRYSVAWSGTEEEKQYIVLDGRYTANQLEALALIMRNEPDLFKLRESTE